MVVRSLVRSTLDTMGYEVRRRAPTPPLPTPRWSKASPHPALLKLINGNREAYRQNIDVAKSIANVLARVPVQIAADDGILPWWDNVYYSTLDGITSVTMFASCCPKRYLEIGSGMSTRFARFAVSAMSLPTSITCIDPLPRFPPELVADKFIQAPLEGVDQSTFDELEANDILFFDGSHYIEMGTDVTVFFLEILPKLKPGVIVHIHDIFWPFDYPPAWADRRYNEQYLLGSVMLAAPARYQSIMPNYFICTDNELLEYARPLFAQNIPLYYATTTDLPGTSFWLRISA